MEWLKPDAFKDPVAQWNKIPNSYKTFITETLESKDSKGIKLLSMLEQKQKRFQYILLIWPKAR